MTRNSPSISAASFTILLLLAIMATTVIKAEVVIENNGYRGIVIAIHKSVPESPLLLRAIKNMIKKASTFLYNSTKQMAYIEQATIVVPASWSTLPEYTPVPNQDYMNSAEVRIAPPHPGYGDIPYTLQLGECGERGQYIHLTPAFLLQTNPGNKTKDKRNGKIFLHEWSHLRYGVFNEYGESGNPNSPLFYMDIHDKIRPNACSLNIKGRIRRSDGKSPCIIDINNNLISDCTFFPDIKTGMANGSGRASPMYMPELDSADEFCGTDSETVKHDPSAPNMQNRMCNSRSVVDVILSNPDFKDGRNSPRDIKKLSTEINVVQIKKRMSPKFVLVLDVSGSMKGDRMSNLQFATSRFIKFHIKEACNITLGMVSFASNSMVLANLTLVDKAENAEQLRTMIPQIAEGGTAIGKGILMALQVLRLNGDSAEKSRVILLTDGEENAKPYVNSTYGDIMKAGVVIYTLAIGKNASKSLEEISKMTNGRADFYDPNNTGKSLDSILNAIIIDSGCGDLQPIITTNRAILVESGKDIEGVFDIDNDVRSTVVFMSYNYPKASDYSGRLPLVTVSDPQGKKYTQDSPECTWDKGLNSILFKIPQAQVGKWRYRLENPGDEHVHIHLMITSDTNDAGEDKNIRVKTWISEVNIKYPQVSKIFAEVKKDYLPVVRANVVATGYRPDGSEEKITLKDNGKGADIYANDGVYTEYFTRYNGSGRYAIDVHVENTPYTKLNTFKDFSRAKAPTLPMLPSEDGEESSSDFSLSDLQQVNEAFDTSAIYNADKNNEPDFDSMDPVVDFQRFGTAGTFFLNEWKAKDLISPSKITDLHVTCTDFIARTVELEWTSPGDDKYDGQATSIELRYHNDMAHLAQHFEHSFFSYTLEKGTLQPPRAYAIHSVVLRLPPEGEYSIVNSSRNVYFAVRALDDQQNVAPVSNVAIAHFPTNAKPESVVEAYWYLFVVAIIVGSALLVVAIFVSFLTYLRRRQPKDLVTKTKLRGNVPEEMVMMPNSKT